MKMKVILMVAMIALSGTAYATNDRDNGGGQGGAGGDGGDALALQGQGQAQGQLQGQAQGQLQGQAQSAIAGAAAGAVAGAANNTEVDVHNRNVNDVNNRNSNDNANLNLNRNVANGGEAIQGQQQGNVNVVGVRGSEQSQTATGGNATGGNSTVGDTTATGGSSSANANNAGNTQTVNFNEAANKTVRNVGTVEVRSVPTAIAPNVYPTASCAMSASVGASALGWGVSGGGTKVNEECMMLEGARMFSQLGYPIQGIILACSTKSALAVFGTAQKCVDAGIAATPVAAPVEPVAAVQPVKVEPTVPYGEVK